MRRTFSTWVSWIFLALSILLLMFTYYRAGIIYQGTLNDHYFKYYLIVIGGVAFWVTVLQLKERIRINVITVVIFSIVGLYMVEGGLVFLKSIQPNVRAVLADKIGIEYDKRTRLEVIEDLIAEGVSAVPTVFPQALLKSIGSSEKDINALFPLGGISNRTTVYGNESGKYLIYKSDRYGFNNPDNQWNSQPIEWLLLGDSFAHGAQVQPGQEIAGQIRSITGNRAINLGIRGNGPLVEYATLVEYGKAVNASKVLWIYFEGNDLVEDLEREKNNPLLMQYMKNGFSQSLLDRQKEIDIKLERDIVVNQGLMNKTRWTRLYEVRRALESVDIDVDVDVDVTKTSHFSAKK